MKILILIIPLLFSSCTTFSTYSQFNKERCRDQAYYCVVNDSLGLEYKSFGGFKFANSVKEYRKMKVKNKPRFKNIIAYGKSTILKGDYYLILDNKKYPEDFIYRDTIINGKKITIALNKNIHYQSNVDFLLDFNPDK